MAIKDNPGQVLFQVQELLRNSFLRISESGMLAFQLLVWAHLSAQGHVEDDDLVEAALNDGAKGIVDALGRLARYPGAVGQAFSEAPRNAQNAGEFIVPAMVSARRLAEGGIFERFDPREVAAEIPHEWKDPAAQLPIELAKLMVDLAVRSDDDSIYCPWESSGQFVGALLQTHGHLCVETRSVTQLPALFSLFRLGPTTLLHGDALRTPAAVKGGHLETFDAALSFPPFGLPPADDVVGQDLYGRFPVGKATTTGLMVQHILAQTRGYVAVVVPNSFLFGPGRDREVREYLLQKGWLEAVIALPPGIYPSTNIPSGLLLLNTLASRRHIAFIDATKDYFKKQNGRSRVTLVNADQIVTFCRTFNDQAGPSGLPMNQCVAVAATVEEVLDKEASLQVDRYVMASEQRELQARMEAMPTVLLDDIAEFHNPIPNKDRKSEVAGAIEVLEVGAADLPPAGYIANPQRQIFVQLPARRTGRPEDAFLRPGDVLLVTKGSVGKVGIVSADAPPPGPGGWVAGQSAIVLRSKAEGADLRGLGLWLRSSMGKGLISGIISGAAIPMASISDLRKLPVPRFTREAMDRAAHVLDREAEIQMQIESLKAEQSTLSELLWNELLGQSTENDVNE